MAAQKRSTSTEADDARALPRMIPWHRPELRAARAELMSNVAWLEARQNPAFQCFLEAALAPVKRKTRGGSRRTGDRGKGA